MLIKFENIIFWLYWTKQSIVKINFKCNILVVENWTIGKLKVDYIMFLLDSTKVKELSSPFRQ